MPFTSHVGPDTGLFRRCQLGWRRLSARFRRVDVDAWINESAGTPPGNWPGWPGGKKFALVLTHDVEGPQGLARCRHLMQLEQALGFRSSFHFAPEGPHQPPRELRDQLRAGGFEVGLRDPQDHGGSCRSRLDFRKQAQRINTHLREWGATGFRSGARFRGLDLLCELQIAWDLSTFDTEPFELQAARAATIFPFWVPDGRDRGYAELPRTLPADTTLFCLLGQKSGASWEQKLDWIAEKGGMALLTTHPNQMSFAGQAGAGEYPAQFYRSFLEWVRAKYDGRFWLAQPGQMAAFVRQHRAVLRLHPSVHNTLCCRGLLPRQKRIWIDLENTPHIPFFKPVIRELERRDVTVLLTARDAFQTCEMASRHAFPYLKIGRHYGGNRLLKVLGLMIRSLQLIPFVLRERPHLGLSHGSRAQMLVCNLLRIPTVLIMDYEHAKAPPLVRPWWEIVPEVLAQCRLHCRRPERIRTFQGIKEDVYVPEFKPDPSIVNQLHLNGDIVVTVRPPATEAHYHNPEAEVLFTRFMDRICLTPGIRAVLLPRNRAQRVQITTEHPGWFRDSKVTIPAGVVDGLNLLWHSDLAVSGGGTMNREAAALGVPVYSIFRGKIGAVDTSLQAQGRLTLIKTAEDVDHRILFQRRARNGGPAPGARPALRDIVGHVEAILNLYWKKQNS